MPNLKVIGTEEDFLTESSAIKFFRDMQDDIYAIDRLDIEHPPILYYLETSPRSKINDLFFKGLMQRNNIYLLKSEDIKVPNDKSYLDTNIEKTANYIYIDIKNRAIVDYLDGFVFSTFNSIIDLQGLYSNNDDKKKIEILNKRPIYLREFIHTFDNENSSIKKFNIQVKDNDTIGSYTKDELIHNLHSIYWDFLVDKVRITDVINIFIYKDIFNCNTEDFTFYKEKHMINNAIQQINKEIVNITKKDIIKELEKQRDDGNKYHIKDKELTIKDFNDLINKLENRNLVLDFSKNLFYLK
jgi:hypothetical protein